MDVITTHINADFDALASMVAAKKLYPDAVLAFPGGQEKSIRDFMLHSTAYVLDIRKTADLPLSEIRRLILVDIRQAGRIGQFASVVSCDDVEIHIYDHHPSSQDDITGTLEIIKQYGSTTAIMCEQLQEHHIELTNDEATLLMLGIYEDTGNLTFPSTTVHDFNAAAYLLSQGASLNVVADMVIKELTPEQVYILNEMIENSTLHTIHGIDVMLTHISSEDYIGDFAILVHKLKNMERVSVLFALAGMHDRIYVVARSRIPDVHVGEVLSRFGGGGHATAASATVHDMNLNQIEEALLGRLQEAVVPVKSAKDFMASPVKTIDAHQTIDAASDMLTRYNINVLPVTEDGRAAGLISRQIIEKAKHHGMQSVPVHEYMTTEFPVISRNTSLHEIKSLIIEHNQRFLPVVESNGIIGAVTRTDLLRALHLEHTEGPDGTGIRHQTAKTRTMKSMLDERLPGHIVQLLKDVGAAADLLGCNAYAVGGFVRDIFLKFRNFDIDIVIEGDGIRFAKNFAAQEGYRCKVFKKFGTAVIQAGKNLKLDVASSRLEYYEKPAALPKVEWSSIKLDLFRRDFTINTLALRLNTDYFGELIDFFGARKDIKEKTIRVLHNLSFVEDPSRVFRAVRFEQRFGFHLGKLTKKLLDNAVAMNFLNDMSGKRVFSELVLLLKEEQVSALVRRMHELGLLPYVHPIISCDSRMVKLMESIGNVLSWYDLLYLDNTCEKWFVFFLGLIDGLPLNEAEELFRKFDITRRYASAVRTAKTDGADILYAFAQKKTIKNSVIYRYLNPLPLEVLLFLMAKTGRRSTKKMFSLYFTKLAQTALSISGRDIQNLGIQPGRIYREIIDGLLDAKLNGKVAGKQDELAFVKKIAGKVS